MEFLKKNKMVIITIIIVFSIIIVVVFSNLNLTASNLTASNLAGSNLANLQLITSKLTASKLAGSQLTASKLAGSQLAGSQLADLNLAGSNLVASNLAGSQLTASKLAGSQLAGSQLADLNLAGSNLVASNLAGSQLYASNLTGSNLTASNLAASNLVNSQLYASNLTESNLTASNLAASQLAALQLARLKLDGLNILLWLDATDSQNMILSGNQVTTWKDKSGLNNHMINPPGWPISAPLTNGSFKINNLNVLDFRGNKFLVNDNSSLSISTNYTIFIVCYKPVALNISSSDDFERIISSSSGSYLFIGSRSDIYTVFTGTGPRFTNVNPSTPNKLITSPSLLGLTNNNNNNGLIPYFNGFQLDPKTSLTSTFNGIFIGSSNGPTQFMNGYIGEIIIYQEILSTEQRHKIESYLAWKWGLQPNLPDDHPYKSVQF